jgi:hypothetical protein
MKVLHNSLLLCTSALLWYQTPTAPQLVTGEIKWKIGSNKWYSKVEVKKPPSGVIRMLVRSPGWYLRGVDGSYGTVSFESPGTLEELRKNGWKKATGNRFPTKSVKALLECWGDPDSRRLWSVMQIPR